MGAGPIRFGLGEDDGFAPPMSDINVTPMVDVMLVLLVIFMVAAPLMTGGVPVHLPKTAAQKVAQPKTPLVVSIDKGGHVFVDRDELPPGEIGARLAALARQSPDQVVLVRGDKEIGYGRVMSVMGEIGKAGFAKVSLIAQAPGAPAAAGPTALTPAAP